MSHDVLLYFQAAAAAVPRSGRRRVTLCLKNGSRRAADAQPLVCFAPLLDDRFGRVLGSDTHSLPFSLLSFSLSLSLSLVLSLIFAYVQSAQGRARKRRTRAISERRTSFPVLFCLRAFSLRLGGGLFFSLARSRSLSRCSRLRSSGGAVSRPLPLSVVVTSPHDAIFLVAYDESDDVLTQPSILATALVPYW